MKLYIFCYNRRVSERSRSEIISRRRRRKNGNYSPSDVKTDVLTFFHVSHVYVSSSNFDSSLLFSVENCYAGNVLISIPPRVSFLSGRCAPMPFARFWSSAQPSSRDQVIPRRAARASVYLSSSCMIRRDCRAEISRAPQT